MKLNIYKNKHQQRGFTLLELSIVIVVIGLIVAGISAGQSLVAQAQLKQVSSFTSNVTAAVNSFKLQYDALPGDIPNAHDYWVASMGCSDDDTSNNTGCNGDGDRLIELTASLQEGYRAWEQLSDLGLVDGTFSGNYTTSLACTRGTIVPEIYDIGGADITNDGTNNLISLGSNGTTSCSDALFTTAEAQSIDNKNDDGAPNTGNVRGANGDGDTCLDPLDTTAYDLDGTGRQCVVRFRI